MAVTEGIERTDEFRVEGSLLTDVEGTLPMAVLSTPGMISMMELAAFSLVRDELPPGHATVGFEVCVKHVGGALEGATCSVTARLREVVEDRKLRFDVEVREGDRTIGVGTHERRVVPLSR
jgi:fluoroacetyl-CoA thioesterase